MIDRERVSSKITTIERCLARMEAILERHLGDLRTFTHQVIEHFGLDSN